MPSYLRHPALSERHLAFVFEDALWIAERDGSAPRQLTHQGQEISSPRFSNDGSEIAFASDLEGIPQVYVIEVAGGMARRLTFEAEECAPVCWRMDGRLVVSSLRDAPMRSFYGLYLTGTNGEALERLPVGRAMHASFGEDDDTLVLGSVRTDNARWKRYRGGMQGDAWIGKLSTGKYKRLIQMEAGPILPRLIGKRVWFLSDQDGTSHVWSCDLEGADLQQHTQGRSFFARWLTGHGEDLIYARGGELFLFNTASGTESRVDLQLHASGNNLRRRFVAPYDQLRDVRLDPTGKRIVGITRGRAFCMDAWGVGARPLGEASGVGYRLPRWVTAPEPRDEKPKEDEAKSGEPQSGFTAESKSKPAATPKPAAKEAAAQSDNKPAEQPGHQIALIADDGDCECLELYDSTTGERLWRQRLEGVRLVDNIFPNPTLPWLAVTDMAGRLLLYDLERRWPPLAANLNEGRRVTGLCWSADGRWLAWTTYEGESTEGGQLHLRDLETGLLTTLNSLELPVRSPSFDPEGRFLYVIADRALDPVIDPVQFGASNVASSRIYCYVLQANGLPPGDPRFEARKEEEERKRRKKEDTADSYNDPDAPKVVEIDLEGLNQRLVTMRDLLLADYGEVVGVKDGVLYTQRPRQGLIATDSWSGEARETLPRLSFLDLYSGKSTHILAGILDFHIGGERTLVRTLDEVYSLKTGEAPPEEPARPGPGRHSGIIDLTRPCVEVQPREEWRQMFQDCWRLQRELFWTADMARIDWLAVRERYLPLVERVSTRSEFSDLLWELQGELGTSHAYEMGGDYPWVDDWPVGLLGADLKWDGKGYRIERILRGDSWRPEAASPLREPGVQVAEGERIVAVNGEALTLEKHPTRLLANRAGQYIELSVEPADEAQKASEKSSDKDKVAPARRVIVRTLMCERALRYRDWVEGNRALVRERSDNQLGYLHIPDMGGEGLAEFFRSFRAESKHDGLIVDVRENGGGFVSSIILDCLRRTVIGYCRARYGPVESYPLDAVRGPLVALADQWAGSDGDIFTNAFRDYGLGPVVGKRTWGGVIGIDPKRRLVDGTIVTQPEYAFFYDSRGWSIENNGVPPDFDVDLDPASQAAGLDPQLEKGIEVALDLLDKQPVFAPDFPPVPPRNLG